MVGGRCGSNRQERKTYGERSAGAALDVLGAGAAEDVDTALEDVADGDAENTEEGEDAGGEDILGGGRGVAAVGHEARGARAAVGALDDLNRSRSGGGGHGESEEGGEAGELHFDWWWVVPLKKLVVLV